MITMSEFGRTARENGNRGTDHGHANVMFVLGGPCAEAVSMGAGPGWIRRNCTKAATWRSPPIFVECLAKRFKASG